MSSGMKVKKQSQKKKATGESPGRSLFDQFLDELSQIIEFESGSLFLLECQSGTLKEVANKGNGIDFITKVHFPLGKGLSAWVAQKGKIVYLPDIHRGSRHGLQPIRSYLSIPLEVNNKTIGVLNLGHVVPNAFDKRDLKLIETFSKEIARKIYNRTYLSYICT